MSIDPSEIFGWRSSSEGPVWERMLANAGTADSQIQITSKLQNL